MYRCPQSLALVRRGELSVWQPGWGSAGHLELQSAVWFWDSPVTSVGIPWVHLTLDTLKSPGLVCAGCLGMTIFSLSSRAGRLTQPPMSKANTDTLKQPQRRLVSWCREHHRGCRLGESASYIFNQISLSLALQNEVGSFVIPGWPLAQHLMECSFFDCLGFGVCMHVCTCVVYGACVWMGVIACMCGGQRLTLCVFLDHSSTLYFEANIYYWVRDPLFLPPMHWDYRHLPQPPRLHSQFTQQGFTIAWSPQKIHLIFKDRVSQWLACLASQWATGTLSSPPSTGITSIGHQAWFFYMGARIWT